MSYIKIEWSGYWDFPNETYSGGSKDGDPISGEFIEEIIDLTSVGEIQYNIEDGEPTFPTYSSFEFNLKNRDKNTGEFIFDYETLSQLGRTKEYGGSRDAIGDLFVRVSIPMLNNAVVYVGFMEDFSYDKRDFHVTINTQSIIRFIKDSQYSMLNIMKLGSGQTRQHSHTSGGILNEVTGGWTSRANDSRGVPINFEELNVFKIENYVEKVEQFIKGKNEMDFYSSGGGWSAQYFNISEILDKFDEQGSSYFIEDEFANKEIPLVLSDYTNNGNYNRVGTFEGDLCRVRYGFVKLGESTLLTRYKPRFKISFRRTYDGRITKILDAQMYIRVIHHKMRFNKSIISGEKTLVYSRGRFQGSDGEQYGGLSAESISIIDFGDNKQTTVASPVFRTITGESININNYEVYYLGGIRYKKSSGTYRTINGERIIDEDEYNYYTWDSTISKNSVYSNDISEHSETALVPYSESAFNVIEKLVNDFNEKFSDRFCYYDEVKTIFDTSNLDSNKHSFSFIEDLVIYGWNDKKITEVIVNLARKLNSYLYVNEYGQISFHSRTLHENYLPDNKKMPNWKFIEKKNYSIQSGKKYGYGSESYSIKFSDKLEVNNISSDSETERTVTRDGITEELFVTPKELTISNYRTSDLAVPSGGESFEDGGEVPILRESPFKKYSEELFSMLPVNMAINFARSYNYPSRIESINLDPSTISRVPEAWMDTSGNDILDESGQEIYDEYQLLDFDFGIGYYIAVSKDIEVNDVFLVKSITYSPAKIHEQSDSVAMQLLYIGEYVGESLNLRDESNDTILDEIDEIILAEDYA